MMHAFYPSDSHKEWSKPVVTYSKKKDDEKDAFELVDESVGHSAIMAAKLGITIQEYRARVLAVATESNNCPYQTGDTVYPSIEKELKKYGKCMIVGIVRHYDQYGTLDWNNPPFILSVSPLKDRNTVVNCTVGWVTKHERVENEC